MRAVRPLLLYRHTRIGAIMHVVGSSLELLIEFILIANTREL